MAIVEDVNKQWRCLAFKECSFIPGGIHDMKIAFPLGYEVNVNAQLVNPDKSIQYIASCMWRPQHYSLTDMQNKSVPIDEEKYMR